MVLLVGVAIGFYGFVSANPDEYAIRITSGDILMESGNLLMNNNNITGVDALNVSGSTIYLGGQVISEVNNKLSLGNLTFTGNVDMNSKNITGLDFFNFTSGYIQQNLTINGRLKGTSPLHIEDGLLFFDLDNSTELFHIFVSGVDTQEVGYELPSAFDDSLVFETHTIENQYNTEIVFWDKTNQRPMLTLNEGAVQRASVFERSLIIGREKGVQALDENYTKGLAYSHADFDTSATGADLGIEDDLEVLGNAYVKEKMLIGNWTTDPWSKLHIEADTLYNGTEGDNHGMIIGTGADTFTNYYIYMGADNTNNMSYIQSVGNATYQPLVLQGRGGYVGIGTIPDYELDVAGNIGIDERIEHNDDVGTYMAFYTDRVRFSVGGQFEFDMMEGTAPNNYINIGTGVMDVNINAGNLFIGGSEGSYDNKVGIGNSNPGQIFEVGSNLLRVYTTGIKTEVGASTSSGNAEIYISTDGEAWYLSHEDNAGVGDGDNIFIIANGGLGVYMDGGDTSWTGLTSDRRSKTNIVAYNFSVLEHINEIVPVYYNWKDSEFTDTYFGVIAQDVQTSFPEIVKGNETRGLLGVQYDKFGLIAIKAIQEQQVEIEQLQSDIDLLEARIAELERLMEEND